jgi:hypothetical protein
LYKLKYHPGLTVERWSEFPHHQQIIMIANELQRGINMIDRNDRPEFGEAMERAFELIDLTVAASVRKSEIRELLRLREVMAQSFIEEKVERTYVETMMKVLISMDQTAFRQLDNDDQ